MPGLDHPRLTGRAARARSGPGRVLDRGLRIQSSPRPCTSQHARRLCRYMYVHVHYVHLDLGVRRPRTRETRSRASGLKRRRRSTCSGNSIAWSQTKNALQLEGYVVDLHGYAYAVVATTVSCCSRTTYMYEDCQKQCTWESTTPRS